MKAIVLNGLRGTALAVACLVSMVYTRMVFAADLSSTSHGYRLALPGWSVDFSGEEPGYGYGRATSGDGRHRLWFIVSRVTERETDDQWARRQFVKKNLPRLEKHHGSCNELSRAPESVDLSGVRATRSRIRLGCSDGYEWDMSEWTFRTPAGSHRGYLLLFPNAGQGRMNEDVEAGVQASWRW